MSKVFEIKGIELSQLERVSEILKTMAHPIRLEILGILDRDERLQVSEIQELLSEKLDQPMLSHHLIKLKDKGILRSQKEGKSVYYSMIDRTILNLFDCMKNCKIIS